jgi:translation initiation factor IF-1
MVKNTTGGSKHKGMARKLVNAPVSNKIRYSEDEDECYAKVSKMLGNGMCHVTLLHKDVIHDNIVCHIRGKFRSRNKKSNLVTVGATVLVGIRSWSSNLDACDLLYIYNDNQISSLNLPSSLFQNIHSEPIDNDILFSSNLTSSNNNQLSSFSHLDNNNNLNDIDFDDI